MAPIVLLGLAVAGGLAFLKRSSASSAAPVDAALIDPSEKAHPNAALAQRAIAVAMTRNSASLYEMTAIAIETRLFMPKTAANVRTWSKMAQQGGQQVAGEVAGSYSYGDEDEVGAAARAVRGLYTQHKAAKKKKKAAAKRPSTARPAAHPAARLAAHPARPAAHRAARAVARPSVPVLSLSSRSSSSSTPQAEMPPSSSAPPTPPAEMPPSLSAPAPMAWPAATPPAGYPGASANAPAPLVPWSSDYEEPIEDDDDDDGADDGDEVGATRPRKKLPDWLRFSATQSKLTGDPALIRATALVMRRMGYRDHAAIHLKSIR